MDQEIKKQWLDALRSGKYAQGKSKLKNVSNGEYCCLGVLCEVMGVEWDERQEVFVFDPDARWDRASATSIPHHFREKIGFVKEVERPWAVKTTYPEKEDVQDILMAANDDMNWNFNQIADFVESEL